MARDDYYVIVYKILAYLYTQLKNGDAVDAEMLRADGRLFQINEKYWNYIMKSMMKQELIAGLTISGAWGREVVISDLECAEITPVGIEYLLDNSLLEKAKQFLKDIKEITPFI